MDLNHYSSGSVLGKAAPDGCAILGSMFYVECHTCQQQSQCYHSESLLILPSRVKQGKHLFHCTAFCFTCNQQSLSWAYKLQTMISGTLISNLPTRDDPEGPQETFLELCISSMSCNLLHLSMWCKLDTAVGASEKLLVVCCFKINRWQDHSSFGSPCVMLCCSLSAGVF